MPAPDATTTLTQQLRALETVPDSYIVVSPELVILTASNAYWPSLKPVILQETGLLWIVLSSAQTHLRTALFSSFFDTFCGLLRHTKKSVQLAGLAALANCVTRLTL
jgi:hypothetical protein